MKDKIYVTVGWKNSNIPMANKVGFFILPDDELTEIQIAKKFRKQCAEYPYNHGYSIDTKPFKPSDLYWGIFDNVDDELPRIHSDNWHEGILVNQNMAVQRY